MTDLAYDLDLLRLGVSRETEDQLKAYQSLVLRWNQRINLISRNDEDEIWQRHILDSAQIWRYRRSAAMEWLDFGSGAGFPGLVIAVLAKQHFSALQVTLVESDVRKCAFLRHASRELSLQTRVLNERIERLNSETAEIISARALAPLTKLLAYAEKHLLPGGICLFPKGQRVHKEVDEARAHWAFACHLHPSATRDGAYVLEIGGIRRV
jgi:16S rRNA (guanine527-N7)-methyltransferase